MPEAPPEAALSRSHWTRQSGAWAIYLQADLTRGARDSRSWSPRPTRSRSASRTRTSPPTTASGARRRGRSWPAARGWSSTGTGTRSTSATRPTGCGVLDHDGEPGRCYDEVKRIAGDFARAGAAVVDLVPDADVALLYRRESKWAMEFQPPLAGEGGAARPRLLRADLRALLRGPVRRRRAGRHRLRAGIRQRRDASWRAPVLVVAGALRRRRRAARPARRLRAGGGHLVLGFRSGYADEEARPRPEAARPAARGRRRDLRRVHEPRRPGAAAAGGDFECRARAATAWADALVPEGAETLVHYEHPHLGRWAGDHHPRARARPRDVCRHAARPRARGRARALAAAGAGRLGGPARDGYGHKRANAAGERVRFVSNWSWEQAGWRCRSRRQTCCSGTDLASGEALHLEAWDVRVLLEAPEEDDEEGRPREERSNGTQPPAGAPCWSRVCLRLVAACGGSG